MKRTLTILLALFALSAVASPPDSLLISNLQKHINYLASDQLEGRNTGSKGEKLAYKYIIKQYKAASAVSKGSKGYLQTFEFTSGKSQYGKNELVINGVSLQLNEDYYPLSISGSGSAKGNIRDVGYGIIAPTIHYNSYQSLLGLRDAIFLIECSTPDGDNPHSQYAPYSNIKSRIDSAIKKGASAIIFTNTTLDAKDLKANLDINTTEVSIPVIFITASALKEVMKEQFNSGSVTVHIKSIERKGHNVIGFIDNGAATTIVIGAHYDHLGFGHDGNSLYTGDAAIHNGADDNASGTAAVMELARIFSSNGITEKNNFLFICFSGEELGLVGSKYWVEHSTYDTSRINYMINMDMIGRYDPDKGMEIAGLGTSPAFEFINSFSFEDLKFKHSESGTGPTDHTSFYHASIPVLNFFTGTHEDYHKPSDDADKVNFSDEAKIIRLIENIILQLDDDGALTFAKTKETDLSDVPDFKVRLGIIPDYLYDGVGLRVDGVTEGQPASKAGIVKGDIIISIGDFAVTDIMEYMKALAAFKKGDTTTVIVTRGDIQTEVQVTF